MIFCNLFSQENKFALHLYNPIGLIQKAGIKLEYRTHQMGFLLSGIQYYGSLPRYPGTQGGLECRYYLKNDNTTGHESFLQAKGFAGYQQAVAASGDGFFSRFEVPEGNYYGLGFGGGRHFSYRAFFVDLHAGLKFARSTVEQEQAFYITGPASVLDFHFNLGFQF